MKKAISLLLCFIVVFALSACNNNDIPMYEPDNIVKQPTETIEQTTEPETEPTEAPIYQVELMEEFVIPDAFEFHVKESFVSKVIKYPHSTEYWFEANDGEYLVDVGFTFKNIGTHPVTCDTIISANLVYANKYVYDGFIVCEDDNISGMAAPHVTSIAPLTTEYVHYLFEVPDEVAESDESLVIEFEIRDIKYSYIVR